jgi:hypothetical protein
MRKKIIALGLSAAILTGTLGTAYALDTRFVRQTPRLNAIVRCPRGHGKGSVTIYRGFHETGGSFVGFTLTGGQTRRACG